MKESTPKEQILSKIRNALIEKSENPYQEVEFTTDVLKIIDSTEDQVVAFARELIEAGGNFVYCENEHAFIEYLNDFYLENNWPAIWCENERLINLLNIGEIPHYNKLNSAVAPLIGLTTCETLISRTGSVVVSDSDSDNRLSFSLPDIHLIVAYASQVTDTLKSAFTFVRSKYSGNIPGQITVITGPSRTADIEKTLVKGVHGPRELYVFLIDNL